MCQHELRSIRPRYYALGALIAIAAAAGIMWQFTWPPMVPGLPLYADLSLPLLTLVGWTLLTLAVLVAKHPKYRFKSMRHEQAQSTGHAQRQILVRALYRTGHRVACLFVFLTGLLLMPSLVVDLLKLVFEHVPHESLAANIALRLGLAVIFLSVLVGLYIAFRQTREWPLHNAKNAIHLPTFELPIIAAAIAVIGVLVSNLSLTALGYSLTARGLFCIYLLTTRPELLVAYVVLAMIGLAICFTRASLRYREKLREQHA